VKILRFPLFILVALAGCINLPRSFHSLSYKNQKVIIDQHHFYNVGPLSSEWRQTNDQTPGIVFKNRETKATIATEALCGSAFEDLSLEALRNQMLSGLQDVKKIKEEAWTLSERKALYTKVSASLDGVPVLLELVVIKKNQCQFDFMGVSSVPDFVQFVKGFDYR